MLVYGALFADAIVRAPAIAGATAAVGGIGLLFLALVLWRGSQEYLPAAAACLGGVYAVAVVVHGATVDERAPLVAAGLLLCCELAAW